MMHIQPGTTQTVEVRVTRLPAPKLAPEDFARRLLALCTSLGIVALLNETGTAVEFAEGLEDSEIELTDDLVAILQARFEV
jgi:hypothetical protein